MIGGFLGAGKTTAVDWMARRLTERGVKVGLITNDQSTGLVDTAILRSRGHAVEEIAGGCFCCRFPSLQEAASRLTREVSPDVFLAEPVGSCTDLLATVSYPLRRIYGDRFLIAPLTVLVDPVRAARVFDLVEGRAFSSKVIYVYRKQLEEADVILVNKSDTLDPSLRDRLIATLSDAFPAASVLAASARTGDGMEAWSERVLSSEVQDRPTMALDYDLYAEGEAELGWLNATFRVTTDRPFEANRFLVALVGRLTESIVAAGGEVAHLKMTFDPDEGDGLLSVVSIVRGDQEPDLRESILDAVRGGHLIVNLRAELDPDVLFSALTECVAGVDGKTGARLALEHEEHFRPARPVPTHRIEVEGNAAAGDAR
jgi:G3E family GTPase